MALAPRGIGAQGVTLAPRAAGTGRRHPRCGVRIHRHFLPRDGTQAIQCDTYVISMHFSCFATTLASKRRPAELVEIIAAFDFLQTEIGPELRLREAFAHLRRRLILERDGGYTRPRSAEDHGGGAEEGGLAAKIFSIKDDLSTHHRSPQPAIVIGEAQLAEAISDHKRRQRPAEPADAQAQSLLPTTKNASCMAAFSGCASGPADRHAPGAAKGRKPARNRR